MYNLGGLYDEGQWEKADARQAALWLVQALKTKNKQAVDRITENGRDWTAPVVRELQRSLHDSGYYSGKIDGSFGPGTIAAIKAFASK